MSLPHITICDCVTERTGKPHVTITRPQYEALMSLRVTAKRCYELMRVTPPECTIKEWFDALDALDAALRAAGIQIEGEGK